MSRFFVCVVISDQMKLRAIQDFDSKEIRYNDRIKLEHILKSRALVDSPYAEAIPFKRGDKMETIHPVNIG